MDVKIVKVRNLETGRVGHVPLRIATHAVFGAHLEIVPENAKDKVPLTELVSKHTQKNPVRPKPEPSTSEESPKVEDEGHDDQKEK